MARFSAFVLAACALALVAPSHQQYYFPYYPMQGQERLFFGGNLLPGFLVRTSTSTTTVTNTATCTRAAAACAEGAANQPFPNGIARSLEEILADEEIAPSKTVSVEPTALPEIEASARQAYYAYGPQGIDSSIMQSAGYYYPGAAYPGAAYPGAAYPVVAYPGAAQGRLWITRTVTTTTFSTSTRTLTPVCSRPGYFTQCP